jgi:hypothetical protein
MRVFAPLFDVCCVASFDPVASCSKKRRPMDLVGRFLGLLLVFGGKFKAFKG